MTTHNQPKPYNTAVIIIGILLIIFLTVIPLVLIQDSEFTGSDNIGAERVSAIAPDYDSSWISNIWTPPGGETESALFALQAAFGGILIGYFFGYLRGKKGRKA